VTDAYETDAHRERPSQGIFIGWLALGLMIFALFVGLFGIIAGATHGFQ
jgi:hypothetical protein